MSRAAVATFSARPTSVWISTYAVTVIGYPLIRGRESSVPSGQTLFQSVELVDEERGGDVGFAHVETVEDEVLGTGYHADGAVGSRRVAVEAAADPLEHP